MLNTPAHAQSASGGNALFELLFPLVMVFAIIYFLIIRPQQKRQREHQAMVDGVSRGDTIITQGGLVGKVAKVHDDELDVDFGENARMKVVKSMIISVRGKNND